MKACPEILSLENVDIRYQYLTMCILMFISIVDLPYSKRAEILRRVSDSLNM